MLRYTFFSMLCWAAPASRCHHSWTDVISIITTHTYFTIRVWYSSMLIGNNFYWVFFNFWSHIYLKSHRRGREKGGSKIPPHRTPGEHTDGNGSQEMQYDYNAQNWCCCHVWRPSNIDFRKSNTSDDKVCPVQERLRQSKNNDKNNDVPFFSSGSNLSAGCNAKFSACLLQMVEHRWPLVTAYITLGDQRFWTAIVLENESLSNDTIERSRVSNDSWISIRSTQPYNCQCQGNSTVGYKKKKTVKNVSIRRWYTLQTEVTTLPWTCLR